MVTDLHGVTGRDIMDHLIAGERNPKALAQWPAPAARRKIAQLEEALEGAEFFTAEHAGLLAAMLARIDSHRRDRRAVPGDRGLLAPYEEQLQQAESMPGWARRAAQDVIAETGAGHEPLPHRRRTWPPGAGAPRWTSNPAPAKASDGTNAATSTSPPSSARPPSPPVRPGTREGARHRKISRTRGKAKACVATGNTQMRVFHALLSSPGTRYQDLGADWYNTQRQAARRVSRLVGALGAMGYEVTLCRKPAPGPEAAPAA